MNTNTYKFSGYANAKTVDISPAGSKGVVLSVKSKTVSQASTAVTHLSNYTLAVHYLEWVQEHSVLSI